MKSSTVGENRYENENVVNVEYLPPIIEVLEFPESNGKYMAPTTGCVEYADELNEGSGARICKEGKSAKMYVRGENFGVSKPSVVITDMTGRETICKVTKYSHYEVIIDLPEGFGPASLTIFSVQPGFDTPRYAVSPAFFKYSAPDVNTISWGETVDSAYTAWAFDAAGSEATQGQLFIFGENFGNTPTPVNMTIGGENCINANWHPPSASSKPPGTPYLSCEPDKKVVGPQDVILRVAFQTVDVISKDKQKLAARCFPGFYGRTGEYCLKCWEFPSSDGRRQLTAATCSGRYTAPNFTLSNQLGNLSFAARGGSEEPVPMPGFATFPPPECNDGGCLPELGSGGSMIPEECRAKFDLDAGWVVPEQCPSAEKIGPLCHPDRFDGYCYEDNNGDEAEITTCEKDPTNSNDRRPRQYEYSSLREGCVRIEPCTPTTACGEGNTCTEGYVNYYKPFSRQKAIYEEGDDYDGRGFSIVRTNTPVCKIGHFTLPDGSCFAPRCGQCNPMTHFRLDGLCVPCPEYPWLIPALLIGGSLFVGVGTVALSRSGVSFVILNIAIDYMQVLSLFAGARVPWPPIMLDMFIYLRLFSIDIDLAAPECFLRELVTFEYKFYFKMSLPLLAMMMLFVFVVLIIFKRLINGDFTRRKEAKEEGTKKSRGKKGKKKGVRSSNTRVTPMKNGKKKSPNGVCLL